MYFRFDDKFYKDYSETEFMFFKATSFDRIELYLGKHQFLKPAEATVRHLISV